MTNPGQMTWRALLACVAGLCIGNIGWWIQPVLIGQLVGGVGLSESNAGLVASVELGALALSSVSLPRLFPTARLRTIALGGALVAIAAAAVSVAVDAFPQLLAARAFVGLGEGAAFMAANMATARFPDPDRAFGKINFANVVFGIALVSSNPLFSGIVGRTAALPALLAALLLLTPLLVLLPASMRVTEGEVTAVGSRRAATAARSWVIAMLSISFFLVAVMSASIWAFYALIGTQDGLTESEVDSAIAVAVFAALIGSGVVPLVGKSLGRVLPVTTGILLLAGSVDTLCLWHSALAFRVATCVNVAANYVILPYYFAAAADEDPSGHGTAAIGGTFLIVGAIGPYLGGLLMQTVGLRTIAVLMLVTGTAAWVLFVLANVALRRRTPAGGAPVAQTPAGEAAG